MSNVRQFGPYQGTNVATYLETLGIRKVENVDQLLAVSEEPLQVTEGIIKAQVNDWSRRYRRRQLPLQFRAERFIYRFAKLVRGIDLG